MSYIAIDLGTTACKVALYDESGNAEIITKEYPLYSHGKVSEQEPTDWINTIKNSIKQLANNSVESICVSSQGITFLPIDLSGRPLKKAITWLDTSAEQEVVEIEREFTAKRIFEITGKKLLSCYTLPKLIRLKKTESKIYDNTYKFLFPLDYINYILTGNAITDYTIASGSMMFDINELKWSKEITEKFGIDIDKLPAVKKFGEYIGNIKPEIANELGLNKNVRVILGGQDQKLAAIGAGIDDKTATVSLGTATAVSTLQATKSSSIFAFDGTNKIYESVLPTTGAAIKWLKNALSIDSYKEMDFLAEKANGSGKVEFYPDFTMGAAIKNLTLSASKGNIIYALYEGIAKGILDFIPKDINTLRVFGGGAASDILLKIIAKVTGKKTERLSTGETACLGAGILASNGKLKFAKVDKIYD